jgi:hypothetical protein
MYGFHTKYIQDVRDLATEITQHGALLAELLAKEDQLREARQRAISRNLEMTDVEKIVRTSISAAEDSIANKGRMLKELQEDEKVAALCDVCMCVCMCLWQGVKELLEACVCLYVYVCVCLYVYVCGKGV